MKVRTAYNRSLGRKAAHRVDTEPIDSFIEPEKDRFLINGLTMFDCQILAGNIWNQERKQSPCEFQDFPNSNQAAA